jgi:hypothetical protein
MKAMQFKTLSGVLAGFAAGLIVSNLPPAIAASPTVPEELSNKSFDVAVFEVKQKLTPGNFLRKSSLAATHRQLRCPMGSSAKSR